jgi:predicted branched-subunit amino acid permease
MEKILKDLEHITDFSGAFKLGIKAAVYGPGPVLFAGMVGFGAMGHGVGLDLIQTTAISFFVYALPGQIVFIEMMSMGASSTAIALTVALTSTRFLTMVLTLFPQIPKVKNEPSRMMSVHLVAMSAWTFCMRDFPRMKPELRYAYFLGIGLVCWIYSVPGTILGYLLSEVVPIWVSLPLVFVNPLFFLISFVDVVIPLNRLAILVGLISGAIFYVLDPGHALIISGLGFGSLVYLFDYFKRKRVAKR